MNTLYKITIYAPRQHVHPDRWTVRAVEYNEDRAQGERNARMRYGDGYQYRVETVEAEA